MADPGTTKAAPTPGFIYYLTFTALVCGALVMVIEVLGSRVIGPFFGVSLFVWTSLITVTLVALAAGYAAGGVLSDRRGTPDYLYGLILAAGVFVLLIPLLKEPVLKASLPLGLRMGALTSASLLFGPALVLLGCVSPYIIKIAAREMQNIGRTVGVFYAISTVGSFLGTVCTGFVLIAWFRVNQVFTVVGVLLVVLAAGYFVHFRRRWLTVGLLAVPLFLIPGEGPVAKTMANGTTATRIFSRDSFYGNLKVVDYAHGGNRSRELIIDGLVQGGIDLTTRLSVYEYAYFLEFLPYSLNPGGRNCLVIGLGAGVIPMWYESMGIRTDVVDIDPEVVTIAHKYFGFAISGDMIVADARYHLNTARKSYDFVILDVFNGDTTPGHILSREALRLIAARMSHDGVLAVNLAGSLKRETFMTASVVRTIGEVFNTVEVHPAFDPDRGDGTGNLAVIAYNGPRRTLDPAALRRFPVHPLASSVHDHIGRTFTFPAGTPAITLTDDYNPIDFFDSWLKEHVRKTILESTDWDILI